MSGVARCPRRAGAGWALCRFRTLALGVRMRRLGALGLLWGWQALRLLRLVWAGGITRRLARWPGGLV